MFVVDNFRGLWLSMTNFPRTALSCQRAARFKDWRKAGGLIKLGVEEREGRGSEREKVQQDRYINYSGTSSWFPRTKCC